MIDVDLDAIGESNENVSSNNPSTILYEYPLEYNYNADHQQQLLPEAHVLLVSSQLYMSDKDNIRESQQPDTFFKSIDDRDEDVNCNVIATSTCINVSNQKISNGNLNVSCDSESNSNDHKFNDSIDPTVPVSSLSISPSSSLPEAMRSNQNCSDTQQLITNQLSNESIEYIHLSFPHSSTEIINSATTSLDFGTNRGDSNGDDREVPSFMRLVESPVRTIGQSHHDDSGQDHMGCGSDNIDSINIEGLLSKGNDCDVSETLSSITESTKQTEVKAPLQVQGGILKNQLESIKGEELRQSAKSVSFAAGTAPPREGKIALSISRHENFEAAGYIEYTIEVYRQGQLWSVPKRYRHFEALHRDLKKESDQLPATLSHAHVYSLPSLPQKRWFDKQRWINRFDDTFTLERRFALQDYLRIILRNNFHIYYSAVFREFLQIPEDILLRPHQLEQNKSLFSEDRGQELKQEKEQGIDINLSETAYRLARRQSEERTKSNIEYFSDAQERGSLFSNILSLRARDSLSLPFPISARRPEQPTRQYASSYDEADIFRTDGRNHVLRPSSSRSGSSDLISDINRADNSIDIKSSLSLRRGDSIAIFHQQGAADRRRFSQEGHNKNHNISMDIDLREHGQLDDVDQLEQVIEEDWTHALGSLKTSSI